MASIRPASSFPDVKIDPVRDIRIVKILPGRREDALRCQLEAQRLDESRTSQPTDTNFECLSYTWGSWTNHKTIHLNDTPGFPITENLWRAMRRLRKEKQMRRFWIDQISLNQQDSKEKAKQLPRMGDIYQLASKVIVWIGDAPDFSSEQDEAKRRYRQLEHAVTYQDPPWYSRAWVIQEYVKASEPPLFCFGSYEVQDPFFGSGPETPLWTVMKRLFSKNAPAHFRSQLIALDAMRKDSQLLNLLCLAWYTQQVDCQVSKDKVYSLYSMLPPDERSMITVDYEQADAAVFSQATYASMACSKSLTILSLVTTDRGSRPTDLPTWAVNFKRRLDKQNQPNVNSTSFLVKKFLLPPLSNLMDNFNVDRWGLALAMGTEATQRDAGYRWTEMQPRTSADVGYCASERRLVIGGLQFGRVVECISLTNSLARVGRKKLEDGSPEAATSKQIVTCLLKDTPRPYESLQDSKSNFSGFRDRINGRTNLRDIMSTYVYEAWYAAFLQQHDVARPRSPNHSSNRWVQARLMEPGIATLVITEHGFLGLSMRELKPNDLLVLPFGSAQPVTLRRSQRQDAEVYTFQGILSIYGVMDGELKRIMPQLQLKHKQYILT